MPDFVEALTDRDGHRHCLRFTGQRSEFLDQLMGLGALDVETHLSTLLPHYWYQGTGLPIHLGMRQAQNAG
jgi:hypothetical protein